MSVLETKANEIKTDLAGDKVIAPLIIGLAVIGAIVGIIMLVEWMRNRGNQLAALRRPNLIQRMRMRRELRRRCPQVDSDVLLAAFIRNANTWSEKDLTEMYIEAR